jgi:hypothetical protein
MQGRCPTSGSVGATFMQLKETMRRSKAFQPSCSEIESLEERKLMSGGLAGMYIAGSAKALNSIPMGTSNLPGWRQPNYWVGGQIIYSPKGGVGYQAAGQFNYVGWNGSQVIYSGYLKVQNTKAVIDFYGPIGGGLMNYQGVSGFVNGTHGNVNVSFAVGYGLSLDTFNFDGPHHVRNAPLVPLHH